MSYFLAFAGFAALIVLHELGHFAAAKAVGMRVERFSLFFPPLIARIKRGETEYALGSVPLGGYVRITGMSPHEDIPPEHVHRAYLRQPVWKRVVVIAAGPAVNLVLGILIFATLSWAEGRPVPTRNVETVNASAPAADVLRKGDVLLAVDGRRGGPEVLRAAIGRHRCAGTQRPGCLAQRPAVLTIERAGETLTVRARPRYDGQAKRMLLGFTFEVGRADVSPGEGLQYGVETSWLLARETVTTIGKLFYDEQARDEVSGVVGSYEATRQSFDLDTSRAIRILALISLSLAVINLFPFLPLDGGHIFWALAEKVRGRPIPFSVLERVSVVGFVLVAMLFVLGLTNDIDRLSGEGFGVR